MQRSEVSVQHMIDQSKQWWSPFAKRNEMKTEVKSRWLVREVFAVRLDVDADGIWAKGMIAEEEDNE